MVNSSSMSTLEWVEQYFFGEQEKEGNANDDFASPSAIVNKLSEMSDIMNRKCGDVIPDELPWYKIYACFLSLVHLTEEIRLNHPHYRQYLYQNDGRVIHREDWKKVEVDLTDAMEFAELAYEDEYFILQKKLKLMSFTLLRQDLAAETGRVGHYIALDHQRKIALVGLKGTSTFSDVLTDLIGKSVRTDIGNQPFHPSYKSTTIRCHEGILTAALVMADDLQLLVQQLFLPSKYHILICGHSLGAGTACLLGILLRSRIPELHDHITVYAFATPPVLNYDAAIACKSFTTSVVNNSDIVPRMSLANAIILNKLLVKINQKLEESGLSPDDLKSAYAHFRDLMKYDEKTLMSCEELDEFFEEAHRRDVTTQDQLYVPGAILVLYKRGVENVKIDANTHPEAIEVKQGERTVKDDDQMEAVVSDGGMKMLRQFEITFTMITDHFASNYQEAIKEFSSQFSK